MILVVESITKDNIQNGMHYINVRPDMQILLTIYNVRIEETAKSRDG